MAGESESESETLILTEELQLNGKLTSVTLSDGRIWWNDDGERYLTVDKEVLGFVREGLKIRIRAFVGKESVVCCGGKDQGTNRTRKDYVLGNLSEESVAIWCQKLQECLDSLDRPKRLFIIMNPFGGKKSASKIFHSEVEPLLEAANVQYTLHETQYQLHAKEIAISLDLSKYDGIVCVSGDGILVEVVNGLLQRADWDTAIRMPLGIIPAGTGNGMVKSLLDSVQDPCLASNATFTIIRGHKCSLDVATVLQGETRFFSVLMLTWGIVADIDIESEKYRWMGSARIDFYSLLRIIRLRKYHGRISFVPAPGYEAYGESVNQKDGCSNFFERLNEIQTDNIEVQHPCYLGPTPFSENWEWRTIEGPFISVWLHNVPWASEDAMPAPDAKFSDGYLDLIVIRDCTRSSLLALLTKLGDGGHVKSPHVLYLKVKAFCLEPGQRVADLSKGGIIDVDGEILARGEGTCKCEKNDLMAYGTGTPIFMTIDKGLATLFCPA